jgi:hypothetical protein
MRIAMRADPAPGDSPADNDEPNAAAAAVNCPELDCIRGRFASDIVGQAIRRATRLGVGADRVLIAARRLTEEDYLRALADTLGVAFEPIDGAIRADCPLADERLIDAGRTGLLPLIVGEDLCLVVAPRGDAARRISRLIKGSPECVRRLRFTTAERLSKFLLRHAGNALAANAASSLHRKWPALSAAPPSRRFLAPWLVATLLLALAAFILAPSTTLFGFEMTLASGFVAWLGLRLIGAYFGYYGGRSRNDEPLENGLPVYSIIIALYREAKSVDGLLRAIELLDYPREKLDVIIAVEADDHGTRAALAAHAHRLPLTVVLVPRFGPRTKPKALNVVLPLARGTFSVVYDAEDRPESDQLRRALRAFRAGGKRLACVQARLCIDNSADSWIAQLFTTEYAGQFDVFLPGFAALGLPLPLGGSSNHFHTETLRAVGGWDLTRKRQCVFNLGCASAPAGSKAGCRPGWCICASPSVCCTTSACRAFSRFNSSSAATCCRRWCILYSLHRCFIRPPTALLHRSRIALRSPRWRRSTESPLSSAISRRLSSAGLVCRAAVSHRAPGSCC